MYAACELPHGGPWREHRIQVDKRSSPGSSLTVWPWVINLSELNFLIYKMEL